MPYSINIAPNGLSVKYFIVREMSSDHVRIIISQIEPDNDISHLFIREAELVSSFLVASLSCEKLLVSKLNSFLILKDAEVSEVTQKDLFVEVAFDAP